MQDKYMYCNLLSNQNSFVYQKILPVFLKNTAILLPLDISMTAIITGKPAGNVFNIMGMQA